MESKEGTKTHTIDATDRPIGRVATEAAKLLRGKDTPAFRPNIAPDITVEIVNASKARIHYKKFDQKIYHTYSGYPGGDKRTSMQEVIDRKGYGEVLRRAVYGMLPANRLRAKMMKHLDISE